MDRGADAPSVRRVLFVSHTCYLDSSNGASVASRSLMECLARHGFAAAAMTGTALDSNGNVEPEVWMAEQGLTFEAVSGSIGLIDAPVPTPDDLIGYRLRVRDVGFYSTEARRRARTSPTNASARRFSGC
jgi:hypothetical protein